jgi:hypothetical protein
MTGHEGRSDPKAPLVATTRTALIAGVARQIAAALGGSPVQYEAAALGVVEYLEQRTPSTVEPPRDGIARVLGGEGDVLSHADRAALEDAADRIIAYHHAIDRPIAGMH